MRWIGLPVALLAGFGSLLSGPAAASATAAAAGPHIVPLPAVRYLPRTATSYPFDAADKETTPINLAAYGYTEKEYLISGASNLYQWTGTGLGVSVENANVPYTTRILVRAPADPRRFSGRVFVEILNPSNNWDFDVMWGAMYPKLMADGDVWVGVTDDPATFAALKTFDASRYGTLSMPNPDQSATCSSPSERGLGWDILAQVGRLLRNSGPSDPLAAYHVRDIYAAGYSQSASMLVTYINAVAPISELPSGGPVFNGYLVGSGAFNAIGLNPINDCAPAVPESDPRHIVHPPGVPVIATQTQSDYYALGGYQSQRPDGPLYRLYEFPGPSHVWYQQVLHSEGSAELVQAGFPPVTPASAWGCTPAPGGVPNDFPFMYNLDGAYQLLYQWAEDGRQPPHQPRIDVTAAGTTVLDQYGNAVGGVRTPYVDVPTGTWTVTSTPVTTFNCEYFEGSFIPFSAAKLKALYPTHADYVAKVAADVFRLERLGLYDQADGRLVIQQAARSDVP